MKRKFINFILSTLVLVLLASIAFADILPEGYKGIEQCFELSNANVYQEYTFIADFEHRFGGHWYEIIDHGECTKINYQVESVTVYAIKNADFDKFKNILSSDNNTGYYDKNAIKSNENFIPSDIEIHYFGHVPENDPKQKVVEVLDITTLKNNDFEIKKSKVIYTYTDGTTEEKAYQSQDKRPESSRKGFVPWWLERFWFVLVPLLSLAVIIIILAVRKLKK